MDAAVLFCYTEKNCFSSGGMDALTKQELKDKANGLPLRPGVYIMMDAQGTVIYVGSISRKPRATMKKQSAWCQRWIILIPLLPPANLRR